MRSPRRVTWIVLVLSLVAAVLAGTSVARHEHQPRRAHSNPPSRIAPASARASATPAVALQAPPPLPGPATQVALSYALASVTHPAGDTYWAWLARLAPYCAPAWVARLESAATIPSSTVAATVLAVTAGWGSGGDLVADVSLRLDPGGPTAVLVTLAPSGEGWQVVFAR
jgi:hypothetical protein